MEIYDYAIRIGLSLLCGFLLGLERKSRQHTVGIRTLVLISISSTLMAFLSNAMAENPAFPGDPTRIAAGVVTGIGFVGGGAILKQGLNIRGLTTAAIIYASSAIGLACGAGLFIPTFIILGVTLIILFTMDKFEKKLFPAAKTKILNLQMNGSDINQEKLKNILFDNGLIIHDVNMFYTAKKDQTELLFTVKVPDNLDGIKLASQLRKVEKLISFTLSDKI